MKFTLKWQLFTGGGAALFMAPLIDGPMAASFVIAGVLAIVAAIIVAVSEVW